MPKKRSLKLKQFQGSSSSSSNKPAAGQDGGDSPTASVNERLADLRKLESYDAQEKKRELAEFANRRSVPPDLRDILGVPESAPPKPKPGIRVRNRERMRTPGPAAPKSWLGFTSVWESPLVVRGSTGKRKGKRVVMNDIERNRPTHLFRFARMTGIDEFDITEKPLSLTHLALRRLAADWYLLDEEDFPALVDIPLRLRVRLLSYLGRYGPPIDIASLQALVQGSDEIKLLDLAGLAGHTPLTLRRLSRALEMDRHPPLLGSSNGVADSWDAEESSEAAFSLAAPSSRFSNLTHLCLSHPPPTAAWRELLILMKHVPQLTHLSLAYWPRPTLTPNLATATVSGFHGLDVTAGGSHFYSELDQDHAESASLLRQLSSNLLCLQWLDLEGCAGWVPALATLAASNDNEGEARLSTESDGWGRKSTVMSIFMDTWKNLVYLNCSQGWVPSLGSVQDLGKAYHKRFSNDLCKYLQSRVDTDESLPQTTGEPFSDLYEVEKRKAKIWAETEDRLLFAGRRINSIRRVRKCKLVTFDFGWRQRAT